MNRNIYIKFIVVLIFSFSFIFSISSVGAAESLLPSENTESCDCSVKTIPSECKKYCGSYSLNDIVKVGVKATEILLGLSGSVALLFFIYGGVVFLISGGSAEKITKGKTIIVNSVIGIIIIFSSFIIIQFSMKALGFRNNTSIFGTWNQSK